MKHISQANHIYCQRFPARKYCPGRSMARRAFTIRTDRLAVDSRYAKIMHVMRDSEHAGHSFGVWEINSERGIHHWPSRSPWRPGWRVGRRFASWPCL